MSRRSFGTIRKLGSGRYQVRYRNSLGRMVSGPTTFAIKADAQRWLATAEADQLRGTFVDQRGLRLTFDKWVEEWLAVKPGQRAATLARDRAAIRTHFSPAIAGTIGLRWGEAIGLRVGDVDFLRRRLSVRQTVEEVSGRVRVVGNTKSEAGQRTVALPAFLVDELACHLAAHRPGAGADDLVFLGPKGGILRRSFEARVFRPAVLAANLPPSLTFHGLRHVATTLMIANNEHPKVIQHRLGHADPAMSLGVYGHVTVDLDEAAAARLDDLFPETANRSVRQQTGSRRDAPAS